jgi:cyclin-dependent kinase-like
LIVSLRTYGQVFKAKYKPNGKIVAIKKFKESDQDDEHVSTDASLTIQVRKTVLREIQVLKDFKADNIVNLLQVFREEEKLFLVFEYVERTVLEELEKSGEGLPYHRLREITY